MSVLLLALTLALAEEPTASVEGTVVRGSAHLAVPPQRFLDQLRDPGWEGRISGTRTRVEVKSRSGDCQHVAFVSPHPILDAAYETRRCPVEGGWESTLIASDAFSTYRSLWRAVPEGSGSRVTYEVDLTTSLWVPDSLVRSETRRSVVKMLKAMAEWGEAQVESAGPK